MSADLIVSEWVPDNPTPEVMERVLRRMQYDADAAAIVDDLPRVSWATIRTLGEWSVDTVRDRRVIRLRIPRNAR